MEIVAKGRTFATLRETSQILLTFSMTVFAFIFFRANDLSHAFEYISRIVSWSAFTKPQGIENELVWLLIVFIIIEWTGRENQFAIEKTGFNWPKPLRLAFYYLLLLIIFLYAGSSQEFIYFQF